MTKFLFAGAGLLLAGLALATPAVAQTEKSASKTTSTEVQSANPPGQTMVVKESKDKTTIKPKTVTPEKTGTSKADKKMAELNEPKHETKAKARTNDAMMPAPKEMGKK